MRVTLNDIRNLFAPTTRFRLVCVWYDNMDNKRKERVYLDNLFWGISSFASMEILNQSITVLNDDCVEIETDMPVEVFKAMKEYLEKYQEEA
jgi:hypothetical protein